MNGKNIDWVRIKSDIILKTDVISEIKNFGIRVAGNQSSSGWVPCHNPYKPDQNPSAGVNVGSGGQRGYLVTFNQAGGGLKSSISFWDLARDFHPTLSGSEFKDIIKYYANKTGVELPVKPKLIKTYDYVDSEGNLLFQVCRFEPKDFRQRRPNSKNMGNWIWDMKGVLKVPYRLSDIEKAKEIIITEGEKDADNLRSKDFVATTSPGGAGKWLADYNQYFTGKDVVIIPDNDDPGKSHANFIAHNLQSVAKSVKIVNLPNLSKKDDVSVFFDKGNSAEDLRKVIEKCDPIKEKPPQPVLCNPSIYFSGKNFKPLLLVEDLLENNELFYDGHCFYKYGNQGYWERIYEENIEKIIIKMLLYESRSNYIYDAMKILKAQCFQSPKGIKNDLMLLNVRNGMLNLMSKRLLPHDKKYYSTVQLPVNGGGPEKLDKWLSSELQSTI